MNHLFPHPPYAEDQPYARPILWTHCLHRGYTAGALAGAAFPVARAPWRLINRGIAREGVAVHPSTSVAAPAPTRTATTRPAETFRPPRPVFNGAMVLRGAGVGSVVGTALLAVAVPARMWDSEEYGWLDRSWRILENQGQNATDVAGVVGALAGVGWAAAARGAGGWRATLGRIALGNVVPSVAVMMYTMKDK